MVCEVRYRSCAATAMCSYATITVDSCCLCVGFVCGPWAKFGFWVWGLTLFPPFLLSLPSP